MKNDILTEATRTDFLTFLGRVFETLNSDDEIKHAKYLEAIAYRLEKCLNGETKRQIFTLPPRHLKSVTISIAFQLWVWTRKPHAKFLCASYGERLTKANALAVKTVMEAEWFKNAFPNVRIDPSKTEVMYFKTTKNGSRISTTPKGAGTGIGGDFIIIDDPLKASEASSPGAIEDINNWFLGTMLSRLNKPKEGCIIVIMQRLAKNDLVGKLTEKSDEDNDEDALDIDWEHLNLPAIVDERQVIEMGDGEPWVREVGDVLHEDHMGREQLEDYQDKMSSGDFDAQYLQNPHSTSDVYLKEAWLRYHSLAKRPRKPGDHVVLSWDTAIKESDMCSYSVCTAWLVRNDHYYLMDVYRGQISFSKLKKKFVEMAQLWKPEVILIEDAASGTPLCQAYEEGEFKIKAEVHAIRPMGSKEGRWYMEISKFEEGLVFLPQEADFLATYQAEILEFPRSAKNDQVDSTSQFLKWMDKPKWPRDKFRRGEGPRLIRLQDGQRPTGNRTISDGKGGWIARRITKPKK